MLTGGLNGPEVLAMESTDTRYALRKDPSGVAQFSRNALNFTWQVVRLPFATILVLLEPIVGFVLAALAVLGVIAALFRAIAGVGPNVAIWAMLAFSAAALVLLALYYALIRLFTRP
jgi:hypothetical protein